MSIDLNSASLNVSLEQYIRTRAAESGVEDSVCLVEVSDQLRTGRGLILKQDVNPGSVILSLPPSALLSPRTLLELDVLHEDLVPLPARLKLEEEAQRHVDLGAYPRPTLPLSSPQALSLVLASWRVARSRYDMPEVLQHLNSFLESSPTSFDTTPLQWVLQSGLIPTLPPYLPAEGLRAALFGLSQYPTTSTTGSARLRILALPQESFALLEDVLQRFLVDWTAIKGVEAHHRASLSHLLSASCSIQMEDFLWGWLCVNSRCAFMPLDLSPHSDNFTLAPLFDMANHTTMESMETKVHITDLGGLELISPTYSVRSANDTNVGLRKGDEVCLTYGAHNNASLLSEYGFTLPFTAGDGEWDGNRFSDVDVEGIVTALFKEQGQAGAEKRVLLEDHGYWGDWTIHPYPSPPHPSFRLVAALRLLALQLPDQHATATPGEQPNKRRKMKGPPAAVTTSAEDELALWIDTLMGSAELVSISNERRARTILSQRICGSVLERGSEEHKRLVEHEALLGTDGVTSEGEGVEGIEGARLSCRMVASLWEENWEIARRVAREAEKETFEAW